MAPLYQAINVQLQEDVPGSHTVYRAVADPEWTVAAVPNGGYLLANIVDACIQFQASAKSHPDPIHVTAHFLHSTAAAPFHVRVRVQKRGKGFTNLVAELQQNGKTTITSHLIFGILAPPADSPNKTLAPPSPYARRVPLYRHPSTAPLELEKIRDVYKFRRYFQCTQEPEIRAKAALDSPTRTIRTTVGGGGVEGGTWFGLTDRDERITTPSLALFADAFLNIPLLIPKSQPQALRWGWFPTMVITLEFKFPIPPPSKDHASRTVGMFWRGNFINDPQGRHETYVELWSAPSDIGEGIEVDGWRDNQVCLAVANQMSLSLPMEVNLKQGSNDSAKL
ncbi:thioesterase-like superfamily-domain-containing protein [Armillaria borealis]|uniref:Thioesterase-like superfamily-domain-containing protein n=1 Tax=Armillaria borealis TaxID=47425 RepID=A0AA39MPX1_9AGAR|nr:thioesterase-like superfamily-domain-containing protein [Armillaria borealis]